MTHSRIRVAIVDDDDSVRKALARLLRCAGMDVDLFSSGEAFFRSLGERHPDCLLLDVRMPDMNGEEVLEQLLAMALPIPTIIITAHEDEGSRLQARFAMASRFRAKPVNDQCLLRDIQSVVQARQP